MTPAWRSQQHVRRRLHEELKHKAKSNEFNRTYKENSHSMYNVLNDFARLVGCVDEVAATSSGNCEQ